MNTGIVCVLDALATKGVWNIDDPLKYLKRINQVHAMLEEVKQYGQTLDSPYIMDYVTFSDTLIITIHSESIESEVIIPIAVRMIDGCFSSCLAEKLLMRGAISYGKFIKEKNVIIGPAIDDAAAWHDKAQVIGCVLTPNTTLSYESGLFYLNSQLTHDYDYSQHAIKYDTPFKDSKHELYNVNWPLSYFKAINPLGGPEPLIRLKATLGSNPIPADAYSKHLNTIEFFNYSIKIRNN